MVIKMGFADAIKLDMERKGMSEASVGKALGISQQAVHKWIERGFPPMSRMAELRSLLGENSQFAKLNHEDLFGGKTTRTRNPDHAPEGYQRYADLLPSRPLPLSTVDKFAREQEQQFLGHLNGALHKNLERRTDFGVLDYASDKLAVEVAYVEGIKLSMNTSRSILTLMLYRDTVAPKARLIMAWVGTPEGRRIPQSAVTAAQTYGLESLQFTSGRALAELINAIELGEELLEPDED